MGLTEDVKKLYLEGYNCWESVLYVLSDKNKIVVPNRIKKLAKTFKRYKCGKNFVCGIVRGSLSVIDLRYGNNETQKKFIKKFIYKNFKKRFKTLRCSKLTKGWKKDFDSFERKKFCAKIMEKIVPELQKIIVKGDKNDNASWW
jgi:C_GCAxxG_C_C family probable redox protein